MESAIGALGSPDDVFNQRYQDFFDNLQDDSSSLAYAVLASYVNRLTPEMFRSIQQKIQTKLINASRLESSEGIAFFAWTVLKKHPKILTYNQGAYRIITWKALEFAFHQRFIKDDDAVKDDSIFVVPFSLFSTIYANEWKLVTGSITVVSKKKPPYNQDSILDIPLLNEYGNTKKSCLLYFLWALLEDVAATASKGLKINVEYVLKVFEISISLKREMVTTKAVATMTAIARKVKTNFAIFLDRILFILQTSNISSSIAYKFLISLLEEHGSLADISQIYTAAVFKFAESIDKNGTEEVSQNLEIIGRQGATDQVMSDIRNIDDDEEDFESLFDLVICVIETIPTFIPVPYIDKIQRGICKRLLQSKTPTTRDLRLLNALLAIRIEKLPSPLQIARIVYSWFSIYKTPELAPYIKIGKALCDTQRSVRMNSFALFKAENEKPLSNGKTSKQPSMIVAPSKRAIEATRPSAKVVAEAPTNGESPQPLSNAVVESSSNETVVESSSNETVVESSSNETPTSSKVVAESPQADDSDDDCMIIDEIVTTKSATPSSSTSSFTRASRKRKNSKEEKATPPPSKKTNNDENKRAVSTVPDMLKDLYVD